MIYKTDYHVHTWFSDGKGAPEEYIGPAVAAGLKEIGFSEHLTLFRGKLDWSMDAPEIEPYVRHIEALKESVTGIIVKTGLEVDFFPGRKKRFPNAWGALISTMLSGRYIIWATALLIWAPSFMKERT